MLQTRSDLPRSMVKWVSQVAASVGATLVATMIYSALPKAEPTAPATPQPELTSGGKFAARAVVPEAYDGLDTMPLPHESPAVLRTSATAQPDTGPGATLQRAAWEAPSPLAAAAPTERLARAARPSHPPVRAEARRPASEPPLRLVAAPSPLSAARPAEEARGDEDRADGGAPRILPRILPAVLSGAREVWSFTASTGGSLVARVVPQIP